MRPEQRLIWCLAEGRLRYFIELFVWSGSPESHRFCDRVQDAYTMRCCPQVRGPPPEFMLDLILRLHEFWLNVFVYAGSWSCQ